MYLNGIYIYIALHYSLDLSATCSIVSETLNIVINGASQIVMRMFENSVLPLYFR